jgi:hypothetical protein
VFCHDKIPLFQKDLADATLKTQPVKLAQYTKNIGKRQNLKFGVGNAGKKHEEGALCLRSTSFEERFRLRTAALEGEGASCFWQDLRAVKGGDPVVQSVLKSGLESQHLFTSGISYFS